MKPKKNRRVDLEKKRPLFFLIGLSTALLITIFIFQLKSEYQIPKIPDKPADKVIVEAIPITVRDKPDKPETRETESKKSVKQATEEITKKVLKLDVTPTPVDNPGGEESPVDIGVNDELWRAEPVPMVLVQRLAVPYECADLTTRDDQLHCLNEWLNGFIRRNIKVPDIANEMGLKEKVYITFIIDENGYLESVKAENGRYEVLKEEAERVLSLLPQFRPAGQYGKTVKMAMTIPVNFK